MNHSNAHKWFSGKISRRRLLADALAAGAIGTTGVFLRKHLQERASRSAVFVARASSYRTDLVPIIKAGLRSLGVGPREVRGKRILLKPNFIETVRGARHICTQPEVIFAAAEAFRAFGAAGVVIGEASGNRRDTARLLEETELAGGLVESKTPFVDLNNDDLIVRPNAGGMSHFKTLTLPATVEQVDWVVSMPKMKTHHWVGVTLSMKNLFGLMPGIVYGWPKNVFHWAGIEPSILDINATVKPHLAIIDGIVGMEGDGPIMGTPRPAGVIVMGADLVATDATAARIMGIDPRKVLYLRTAPHRLGTIREERIVQRGEAVGTVRTDFALMDFIPAHKGLRLSDA